MNVYLLNKVLWDHSEVIGVFATQELAEEFKTMYTESRNLDPNNFPIAEHKVFGYNINTNNKRK
jgi:hypothetical protein